MATPNSMPVCMRKTLTSSIRWCRTKMGTWMMSERRSKTRERGVESWLQQWKSHHRSTMISTPLEWTADSHHLLRHFVDLKWRALHRIMYMCDVFLMIYWYVYIHWQVYILIAPSPLLSAAGQNQHLWTPKVHRPYSYKMVPDITYISHVVHIYFLIHFNRPFVVFEFDRGRRIFIFTLSFIIIFSCF